MAFTAVCACGCGQPAPLAEKTSSRFGHVAGRPMRFIRGHNNRNTAGAWERIKEKCGQDGECLVWRGAVNSKGYGHIRVGGRTVLVHRAAYEYWMGPIAARLQIDHVKASGCRFRTCCNPGHLEAVTARENTLRSDAASARNARKTHCSNGHALTPDNVRTADKARGWRICRICFNDRERRRYRERRHQ